MEHTEEHSLKEPQLYFSGERSHCIVTWHLAEQIRTPQQGLAGDTNSHISHEVEHCLYVLHEIM